MIGWAWGATFGARGWLTIAGSALYTAELAETPEGAKPPAPIIGDVQILARVERRGSVFRILEIAPERDQHIPVRAVDARGGVTGWCSCSTWRYDHDLRHSMRTGGWALDEPTTAEAFGQAWAREHAAVIR